MTDLFLFYYRTITVGVLGLLCGSFLNVCIYRLPKKESVARGYSYCPHCQHRLAALDLLPLFSYLFLKGRCRYCGQPISARYARIEALTGFCFGLAAALWGSGPFSPAWTSPDRPSWSGPAGLYNGLIIGLLLFAFSALLVWAMIRLDQKKPPRGLYFYIFLPVLARVLLQPEKFIWLAGSGLILLLACLAAVRLGRFALAKDELAGLALTGFWAGPAALVPALILVILLLVRQKRHSREISWQPALVLASFLLTIFANPLF